MVSLMINGYECTVQEGTTILEAAQGAGVQIRNLKNTVSVKFFGQVIEGNVDMPHHDLAYT